MRVIKNTHGRKPSNIVSFPKKPELYKKLKKIIGCETKARKVLEDYHNFKTKKYT